ncbi:MAG: carboxypeptidase M32 [Planctomycetes bacterium]|nr:carboxypeptidase M32 [Planctomycetota bacterium]
MSTAYAELESRWAEILDLQHGQSILGWDQEVMMPPGGANLRAHTLATLAGVIHGRVSDKGLAKLVEQLHGRRATLRPAERRAVDLVRREVRKATSIPARLATDIALAESECVESWRVARAAKSWTGFKKDLARMVALKREVAGLRAGKGPLYDALLDDFEPGATMAGIDPLLDALKELTVPLLQRVVAAKRKVPLRPFVGRFAVDAQRAFSRSVVTAMGIDLERARLDLSTHPFCGGVAPGDVRMTSRFDERDTRGGLFGAIHEAGHGLYEQGLDPKRARSPLGGAISMAIHESQSRLWENNVARGRAFWKHWLPRMKKAHPQLKDVTLDEVFAASNVMGPSMIRVESDELTYNLHIVLRYEIERDLIEGRIEASDLRDRWNEGMRALLGIVPKHDGEGVLQDIHWASGLFGYFPTYSLGNLYAAQFMEAARKAIGDLDARLAKGDLATLREWLRKNVHRHDQTVDAATLVKKVTGKPLSVDAFARHITAKVDAIYG